MHSFFELFSDPLITTFDHQTDFSWTSSSSGMILKPMRLNLIEVRSVSNGQISRNNYSKAPREQKCRTHLEIRLPEPRNYSFEQC